jgi:ubiquinone/menaquinone biosynthesis C-methylase UbiE
MEILRNLMSRPNRDRSRLNYSAMAAGYDGTCRSIERIRGRALIRLAAQPGEIIGDIACGTGATLVRLGEAVGEAGRAIGLEHSEEMARIAEGRVRHLDLQNCCEVRICAAESYQDARPFDALFFASRTMCCNRRRLCATSAPTHAMARAW